ncbi:MAG: lactate utilization protein [Deltaproteobacteria bacterium]|nr:lactate utilization protein [Deltaproteobacteria bacterium]
MSAEQRIFYKNLADMAIRNLNRRHINAQYVPERKEAAAKMLDMIPEGVTVGAGDSETLVQIGIFPALRQRGKNEIINPLERNDEGNLDGGWEEINEMMRRVLLTDVYLSGTNAITLDGKLVNIDGGGNRVAPMIFGPGKVIIAVGANKIVKDVDEAINRIKGFCAPINALRHVIQHNDEEFMELPCVRTGICSDCRKPQRICNFTSIIEGESHRSAGRMNIIIIGEHLGI